MLIHATLSPRWRRSTLITPTLHTPPSPPTEDMKLTQPATQPMEFRREYLCPSLDIRRNLFQSLGMLSLSIQNHRREGSMLTLTDRLTRDMRKPSKGKLGGKGISILPA